MRECGDCSLCCRVMGVESLDKPRGVWCQHCTKPGCKIYDTRPKDCRTFSCAWLVNDTVPEWMKPNKSKLVLSPNPDGNGLMVDVDPQCHRAWREKRVFEYLTQIAMRMRVRINIGGETFYMEKRHDVRETA
jgi:hypothetical protein